jgi:anti-anti-sigma factor
VSLSSRISAFAIERARNGTAVYLLVRGELDLCSAPELRETHESLDHGCQFVVLDLSGVTFMDSSGVHALVDIYEAAPERLRIILSPPAARIIDICKLRTRLPIIEG